MAMSMLSPEQFFHASREGIKAGKETQKKSLFPELLITEGSSPKTTALVNEDVTDEEIARIDELFEQYPV